MEQGVSLPPPPKKTVDMRLDTEQSWARVDCVDYKRIGQQLAAARRVTITGGGVKNRATD